MCYIVSWGSVLCEFEDSLENRVPTFRDIGFKFSGDCISTGLKNQDAKVWTFPSVTLYIHTYISYLVTTCHCRRLFQTRAVVTRCSWVGRCILWHAVAFCGMLAMLRVSTPSAHLCHTLLLALVLSDFLYHMLCLQKCSSSWHCWVSYIKMCRSQNSYRVVLPSSCV
jgi:hypothetical protein